MVGVTNLMAIRINLWWLQQAYGKGNIPMVGAVNFILIQII